MWFYLLGICKPFIDASTYNLTAKDLGFRNSEIIRFCNDTVNKMSSRNNPEPLKSMVRLQNNTNHPERIECPFYGDYIFSYKGNNTISRHLSYIYFRDTIVNKMIAPYVFKDKNRIKDLFIMFAIF